MPSHRFLKYLFPYFTAFCGQIFLYNGYYNDWQLSQATSVLVSHINSDHNISMHIHSFLRICLISRIMFSQSLLQNNPVKCYTRPFYFPWLHFWGLYCDSLYIISYVLYTIRCCSIRYCSIKEELIFYSLEQDLVTVPWVCGRYQRRCWLRPRSVRMWKVFLVTPTSLTALSRTSRKSTPTPTTAKCAHWPSTTAIRLAAVLVSCDWKCIALCVIQAHSFSAFISFIH